MKNKQKVIIIGAGVAGLSAGVYAQASGFEVEIYEQHFLAGGFCTNWKRKGYTFEGGLHWLTGSRESTYMHKVWREIGAITDDTKIHVRDPHVVYDHFGTKVCLYRDIKKLENHLVEVSPDDEKQIKKLCKNITRFSKVEMPIIDIKGLKRKHKSGLKMSSAFAMLPAAFRLKQFNKMPAKKFIAKFKSDAIKGFLESIVSGEHSTTKLMFTLGLFVYGDGGFLEGGSKGMIGGIVNKFESLGGKIFYKTSVYKVLVENKNAVGVLLDNGEKIMADGGIIVTTDTTIATEKFFDKPIAEPWIEKVRGYKNKSVVSSFISLGIEADLSSQPGHLEYALETPLEFAGHKYNALEFYNYAGYRDFAPEGHSVLTMIIMGDNYDFWKTAKENGTYEDEKQKFADLVIERFTKQVPEAAGKIRYIDVATPLTYERYTKSYRGAWMSKIMAGDMLKIFPKKSKTIKGLYFAGFRLISPGGLPIAAVTGRKATQYLCRDNKAVFGELL